MTGINFNFGDPLLAGSRDFGSQYQALEEMERTLAERKAAVLKAQQQMQQQAQQQQSRTPVWDEIDSICSAMSEKEFSIVSGNEEFKESNGHITLLIQQAQLEMLRPVIEASAQGKDALERHLTLVKRLRKSASKEVDDELADFKEYREKYAHMTYEDYQNMKREQPKQKKK